MDNIKLARITINKYFNSLDEYKYHNLSGRERGTNDNFCLRSNKKIIILNRNRFTYSKKFAKHENGDKIHNLWVENLIEYDTFLIERIKPFLKKFNISKVLIVWNDEFIDANDNAGSRTYYIKNDGII